MSAEIERQRNLCRWADSLLGEGRLIERCEVAGVLRAAWSDISIAPQPDVVLRRPRHNALGIPQSRRLGYYRLRRHQIGVVLDSNAEILSDRDWRTWGAWQVPLHSLLHEISHARHNVLDPERARDAPHGEGFLREFIAAMHLAAGVDPERAREVGLAFGLFRTRACGGFMKLPPFAFADTCGLALDLREPDAARACRTAIRSRDALALLEVAERGASSFLVVAGELWRPDAGAVGAAAGDEDAAAAAAIFAHRRLGEQGATITQWIVLGPERFKRRVTDALAAGAGFAGDVQ